MKNKASSDKQALQAAAVDVKPAPKMNQNSQSNPEWNTTDLDAMQNGNILNAVALLKKEGNIKQKSTSPDPAAVAKAPWIYYGKPIKISGTLVIVQEYPPGSDISNVLGGTASEAVIMTIL